MKLEERINAAIERIRRGEDVETVLRELLSGYVARRGSREETLAALESEDYDPLWRGRVTESSLSRVLQHHQDRGFALITAWKDYFSTRENRLRNADLLADIRALGAGAIRIVGYYKGEREESFFVPRPETMSPEEFSRAMVRLGMKYDQEGVLVYIPGRGLEHWREGQLEDVTSGTPSLTSLGDAWSALRSQPHRPFHFEGAMWPENHIEAMSPGSQGLLGEPVTPVWFFVRGTRRGFSLS
jgi:hypothetical protein